MNQRSVLTSICCVALTFEALTAAIGSVGDAVYIPLRITGGMVTRDGHTVTVLGGSDITTVFADEKVEHDGSFVVSDELGDVIVWFAGTGEALEGTYDALLEGRFPAKFPCLLTVRLVSTNPGWTGLNRTPLVGVGSFEGGTGALLFTLMSIDDTEAAQ